MQNKTNKCNGIYISLSVNNHLEGNQHTSFCIENVSNPKETSYLIHEVLIGWIILNGSCQHMKYCSQKIKNLLTLNLKKQRKMTERETTVTL